jgi:hypothetical protein
MAHGKRPTVPPQHREIFLAGIIQGSHTGSGVVDQSYRERLTHQLAAAFPALTVYCPVAHHPASIDYSDDAARSVFFHHIERIRHSALLVAFLPSASTGTGAELLAAYEAGVPILAVSPMTTNWTIRLLASRLFADEAAFTAFLASPEREPFGTFAPGSHRTVAALAAKRS